MSETLPIWHDDCADDLRAAGPAVMLVAAFLKYSANAIGFFPLKFDAVSRATGLLSADTKAALPVLEQMGFLRYHEASQMVWLIDHAKWNLGHLRANNKKMITKANAEFAAIPKTCPLRVDFLWQHALMLRLQVIGAVEASEVSFDSYDQIPPDLLLEVESDKSSRDQASGRPI